MKRWKARCDRLRSELGSINNGADKRAMGNEDYSVG